MKFTSRPIKSPQDEQAVLKEMAELGTSPERMTKVRDLEAQVERLRGIETAAQQLSDGLVYSNRTLSVRPRDAQTLVAALSSQPPTETKEEG